MNDIFCYRIVSDLIIFMQAHSGSHRTIMANVFNHSTNFLEFESKKNRDPFDEMKHAGITTKQRQPHIQTFNRKPEEKQNERMNEPMKEWTIEINLIDVNFKQTLQFVYVWLKFVRSFLIH